MFDLLLKLSRRIPGISKIMRVLYSCDIPRQIQIGKGSSFGHNGFGVVLHPNTVIEEKVFIQHHVSTGVRWTGDKAPIIKSGARLGAYSIILGTVTIGENAIIGAGTVVTYDVPANTVYVNQRVDRYLGQNPLDPIKS